ncbi:MAG: hypothetical protein Q4F69_12200 [Bacteroidia bacterium]|nr:hypothetical protein [Bacteroidia bacterium]
MKPNLQSMGTNPHNLGDNYCRSVRNFVPLHRDSEDHLPSASIGVSPM